MLELQKHDVDPQELDALASFVDAEEYDTESIVADLADIDHSNLKKMTASSVQFEDVGARMIVERRLRSLLYSPGKRYFYWPHYRDNEQPRRVVWQGARSGRYMHEENSGSVLGDWFIDKKYGTLKEELLNTRVLFISNEL